MESNYLSIRQRKLLQYLQSQTGYITGLELANFLEVSPRTIRNDISEINPSIAASGLHIDSQKGTGYKLTSNNDIPFHSIKILNDSFLSRDERVFYLAFQLCLSEIPINLYDLEDEMYVSRTTLEHDLSQLTKKYMNIFPYIHLTKVNNSIEFEKNERKRRAVLNRLIHEDWNYNGRGSTLYSYNYLDEDVIDLIINEVSKHLSDYDIQLEDTNSVLLNLAIAIMHIRIQTGHELSSTDTISRGDDRISNAVDALFNALEVKLSCPFCPAERNEIYLHILNSRLMDASLLNFATVKDFFSQEVIFVADTYLKEVDTMFQINLTSDEDFYITLLQYIKYLKSPMHLFNMFQVNQDIARSSLLVEYEIAYLFQNFAKSYIGTKLNETELIYLAMLISGSIEFNSKNNNQMLFKTVILCHLNLYAIWSIKRKLLAAFDNFIDVVALLPVNAKNTYDFKDIDIVVTTVNKKITTNSDISVIYISPFMNKNDYLSISEYIESKRLNLLSPPQQTSLLKLLSESNWQENIYIKDKNTILKILYNQLIENNRLDSNYFNDLVTREENISFAFKPGIAFVYSLNPCEKTMLTAVTLKHRIAWNNQKIRIVIMAAFHPNDYNLIFRLLNELYHPNLDSELMRGIKTKNEFIDYIQIIENKEKNI